MCDCSNERQSVQPATAYSILPLHDLNVQKSREREERHFTQVEDLGRGFAVRRAIENDEEGGNMVDEGAEVMRWSGVVCCGVVHIRCNALLLLALLLPGSS